MPETSKTSPCTSIIDVYSDVPICPGDTSYAGLQPKGYFIRKSDIVSFPKLKGKAAASLKDIATLDGEFVLALDKKWHLIDLSEEENDFVAKPVGAYPNQLWDTEAHLVVPGTAELQTGLAATLLNDDTVFLLPTREGKFRLFGCQNFRAKVVPELNSGKKIEDTNTTSLVVTSRDFVPAPFFTGKITTEAGDISGVDGSIIPTE